MTLPSLHTRLRHLCSLVPVATLGFVAVATLTPTTGALGQAPEDAAARVDEIFAPWDSNQSAGCAVGVMRGGLTVMERAYGMADLEHDIPNTTATIFEGGSLSKQFTSAAVVLLALDGALSLDEDVRTYVPELPDYGHTITLHHLMTHTSGLRDWGNVAGISGWGREQRSHDHDDVLDILRRQSALNFEPGHEYSYSNSGYNLLAIVVARVSGMSFAEFSRRRIFEPLGLRDTQWRDDHRRIVPGRSSAYNATDDGWEINRPLEYVHGNGGILTTVADLGIWNQALTDGRLGGQAFLDLMHRQGVLSDGSTIVYAGGLRIETIAGVRAVTHTGSTAGYRAFLGRYPDQGLSVAMLCNASNAPTGGTGERIARVFLGTAASDPMPHARWPGASAESTGRFAGLYADPVTGSTRTIVADGAELIDGRTRLVPLGPSEFGPDGSERRYRFRQDGASAELEIDDWQYTDHRYLRVEPWVPEVSDLGEFAGTYVSEEAETTLVVTVTERGLALWRRPADTFMARPVFRDAFESRLGTVRFRRDDSGRVSALSLSNSRVYDMRFESSGR